MVDKTEIMPDNMPKWMLEAIKEGQLARRSMEKVAQLETETATLTMRWESARAYIRELREMEGLLVDAKSAMEDCMSAIKFLDVSNEFIQLNATIRGIKKALETHNAIGNI